MFNFEHYQTANIAFQMMNYEKKIPTLYSAKYEIIRKTRLPNIQYSLLYTS